MAILDTVIVGGGQAGLAVSYFLQKSEISHVLFEQGRIGESWLLGRWDSFQLNTPNVRNVLPGLPREGRNIHKPCPHLLYQRGQVNAEYTEVE